MFRECYAVGMKQHRPIKKPITVTEEPPEWVPRDHLVDLSDAPAHKTHARASEVLAKIPGGFQRFVVSRRDGMFVPVCMLMPSECTPDIIDGCRRSGAHVMLGLATAREWDGRVGEKK